MSPLQAVLAVTLVAILGVAVVESAGEMRRWAIAELNGLGRDERARQEEIRIVVCHATPDSCSREIPRWIDG